ncbi:MAG: histidine kinase [Bacteroidales bacterium]|nr:histidine kinase [Bacteroidales bacterium]
MGAKGKHKSQQDLTQAISELNKSFSLITDLVQLRDNFVARVKEITTTKYVTVFLMDHDYDRYYPIGKEVNNVSELEGVFFQPGDKLIFWLNVNKTLLNIPQNSEVFSFFTDREKAVLQRIEAVIVYPFVSMNQVKGLVVLGEKESGNYNPDELRLLSILFEQASFAFENSLLYMQQRERASKMYRADRLATLGELAAGAAHEIRNPLTSIRSTIQYLKNRITDREDKSMAEDLINEVDRINDIIQGMLSFAKPVELRIEETDFYQLICQTIRLVNNSAEKKGIKLELDFDSDFKIIFVDTGQIKQVLINILMNAVQAIQKPAGIITISVRGLTSEYKAFDRNIYYLIEIKDNGPGIPQNLLDKVFDPFYTTKQEGTGLGLSITYTIINRHRGDIEIQSELGKGTMVKIKLPGRVTIKNEL